MFYDIFLQFCQILQAGQTPKYCVYTSSALAGWFWVYYSNAYSKAYKTESRHPEKIVKDFFILDQKCDIIEVGHIGLPP